MRHDYIVVRLGLPEFRVLQVVEGETLIEIWIEKVATRAACPDCGGLSDKYHDCRWDDVFYWPLTNGFTEGSNNPGEGGQATWIWLPQLR